MRRIRFILGIAIAIVAISSAFALAASNPTITVKTNKGTFVMELYPQETPVTAANFVKLAKKKFYDGLTFHRYEPGFVIQGGDPEGTGQGGPGYTIKDEANKKLTHVKGAVGLAKTQLPNSGGSQFYICLSAAHFLDGRYTVFGKVIKGMDVVGKLRAGDKMLKVTVSEPKSAAKKPAPKKK